ncbi:hypothetical protein Tco_0656461 [Tanacetum coccineum]|uniref:Uncharacterized protein n=1 Tax=Tanacetum coccineum TaxID=301880 RepID=A0ABQ4XA38_9ASTR
MAASTKALIVEYASTPTPPSPPLSPLSPLSSSLPRIPSSPIHTSPIYASAPLGYRAAMVQLRAASPLPVPSPPLPIPSPPLFEVRESSTTDAARQTGRNLARRVDYGFIDTMDASVRASESRVMTAVDEVNARVTDLASTQRQNAHELYVRDEDAQDDRALLRAQISLLMRERLYFRSMASSYEREAIYARHTWSRSEDRSTALEALIRAQEARITVQEAHTRGLQRDVSVLQR